MFDITIYIKVFFATFVDQNPVWRSPSKTFALIAATNIQRTIVEMKKERRAMTVVKNYVNKCRLWDYNDAHLEVNSKIEIKWIVCKSVSFCRECHLTSVS